ncbi:response regulator [Caulobacter vibrioides]|uniref:hybrid sensor histidine kinase/response regulator n=1 Tax=Caulobacter vibrioides TaxID=155892 RepID=UPI000BB4D4B7|nr:ATP-binding protein [Caulobacter vibrioides]ATC25329.1 hybrid sensor histidine kinase/response regulator [Caulobacter vibrioides]AZH13418.1 response regulator [Caulobacter vibrioides]PLR14094.1 hybrid sensor histidine kinase/response regulator [Caulobacter vibrioides]
MLAERRPAVTPTDGAQVLKALDAQAALLPYALGVFAVSLPLFVWVGSFAANPLWMTASFAIFAINWGVFYAAVSWIRDEPSQDLARRARVQVLCGVLWALAVMQISAFAHNAGPARETLLLLATAGAVLCAFFAAPYLPGLLIIAPLAAAGPLLAQFSTADSRHAGELTFGATALAMTLALILNRMFRRQHDLAISHEQLVVERLRVLEAAERTARSKSDIVATLSHEIRNGLTGVTHVLAAAAGRGGRAAPSREQLNAALDAAQDLIAVLNATLDSETAESGRLQVDARPFDPVRLVQDLALLDKPHAAAKGLELSVHVDPLLRERAKGAAIADALRTRQIVSNLLGNAVKYTVRGRVEVRLELRDDRIAIEVADTGPGLSTEELEQAFEPFRRVERTGAGVNGAGLGLSLSRQLARLMGGALEARSAVGVGSCFTLTLPFDLGAKDEQAEALDTAVAEASGAPRALRVLIAEDDALNAAMLRAVLEQLGHQVVHAANGRRAADLAKIAEFDLLMLDHRMPVMDGPEAASSLRQGDGPNRQTPIVAVIDGDAEEAAEFLEAGAEIVLRKPVSVAGVARALADAAALERTDPAKVAA